MENENQNQQVNQTTPVQTPPTSSTPARSKSKLPLIIVGVFLLLVIGGSSYYLGAITNKPSNPPHQLNNPSPSIAEKTPTPIPTTNQVHDWKSHTISDANLTFLAPNDLKVTSETQNPGSLTLYVEKNTGSQNPYQLYGIYQWDIKYSRESLEDYKQELEPSSIKDLTISGFPAVEGQVNGPRNRFVTKILTNKGMFTLYTAEPTTENKQLSDQILSTFKFTN